MWSPPQDSAAFQVVYDVRQTFPDLWAPGLIAVFLLVIGVVLYRQAGRFESPRAGFIGLGLIGMSSLLTLFFVGGVVLPYLGLRKHLSRGEYRVVQGTVQHFIPGDGHRPESWSVQSPTGELRYSYSPAIVGEGGYDRVAAYGGIVAEGKVVRLLDVNGRIARLEIAQ